MSYRNTPHPSTGLAPAEIMFSRKVHTKLPQFSVKPNDRYIRERDTRLKYKNKRYADIRRKAKPRNLQIGDNVLLKQPQRTKLDSQFNPKPAKVVQTKGSMITVQHEGKHVTRDISHFKFVPRESISDSVLKDLGQGNVTSDTTNRKVTNDQKIRKSGRKTKIPKRYLE